MIVKTAQYIGDFCVSVSVYKIYAAVLDKFAVDYPEKFAVKALLFMTDHLQAGRRLSVERAIKMFSIPHNYNSNQCRPPRFQLLAPLLQNIWPLSTEAIKKALVEGLFHNVLLSYMAQPEHTNDAFRIAHALRDASDEAASRDEAAREAHISDGQSAITCPHQSWITDMRDAASAIIVLYNGRDSYWGETGALHRVRQATTGSLLLLASSIKKEPWATMANICYDSRELFILPEITESLRACALHPAVWARAAARIPGWKINVRPGRTQQLEDKLWKVLLKAWESLDKFDADRCCELLEHLHLARCLTATSKPTDAELDAMQELAPQP